MKIVMTGGGSGGHFYPIIAVAEELNNVFRDNKLVAADVYFLSDRSYNAGLLYDNHIIFKRIAAGKLRRYFSLLNIIDAIKTAVGLVTTFIQLWSLYPDIVFSKGGYASFPVLVAARLLRIPVVVHESDSVPGRVNRWAGKFAARIAVSYPQAAAYFPKEKIAYTGNPIRRGISIPVKNGALEFLGLDERYPVLFVLGGSLGAELLNDTLLDVLPELIKKYQVIHQTGKKNFRYVSETARAALLNSDSASRYRPFDYLNDLAMSMASGVATLVISRAGSTIFEISAWGTPSIVIPITDSEGNHQRANAYNYARAGAAVVVEEANLTPHLLLSEINRLCDSPEVLKKMHEAAQSFAHPHAARKIAEEIIHIALEHEK